MNEVQITITVSSPEYPGLSFTYADRFYDDSHEKAVKKLLTHMAAPVIAGGKGLDLVQRAI